MLLGLREVQGGRRWNHCLVFRGEFIDLEDLFVDDGFVEQDLCKKVVFPIDRLSPDQPDAAEELSYSLWDSTSSKDRATTYLAGVSPTLSALKWALPHSIFALSLSRRSSVNRLLFVSTTK